MDFNLKKIAIKNIDFSDTTFQISYPAYDGGIEQSIADSGFLSSPVVKEKDDKYLIISGFRRLHAAKKLNLESVTCIVSDFDDYRAFKFAVMDNLSQRKLNIFEISMVIEKFHSLFNLDYCVIAREILPLLGYPPSAKLIDRLLFADKFSQTQKKILFESGVEPEKILSFQFIEKEIWDEAIRLLCELKPGVNKFNQILELIKEISQRENISQKEVLAKPDVRVVLENGNLTAPQKTDQLRIALFSLRNPEVSGFEEEYSKRMRKLNIGKNLKISPPQSFENEVFKMEFSFKNVGELKKNIEDLIRLSEKKELDDLIDLVRKVR